MFCLYDLPLLSCSYWNTAPHPCGTFLFGHGFLHSLFKMMNSCLTASGMEDHKLGTDLSVLVLLGIHVVGHIEDCTELMEPCGPLIKIGPVLPPSGD